MSRTSGSPASTGIFRSSAYCGLFFVLLGLALLAETALFDAVVFSRLTGFLNGLFIVLAISALRGYVAWMSSLCLILASVLALMLRLPLHEIITLLNRASIIVPFMAVVPLVSMPIRVGSYFDGMTRLASNQAPKSGAGARRASVPRYAFLVILQLLMSFILNIGSIPEMRKLLRHTDYSPKATARLFSAGYSAYMVTAPFDGLILSIILLSGASYASYIPFGLAMFCLIAIVALVVYRIDVRDFQSPVGADAPDPEPEPVAAGAPVQLRSAILRITALVGHILAMILLAALAHKRLDLQNPTLGSALVVALYSLVWYSVLTLRRKPSLPAGENLGGEFGRWKAGLLAYRGFLPFLISAGFLASLLARTAFRPWLIELAGRLDFLPLYWTLLILMIGTGVLGLCGIHMMITVSALAAALSPASLGLSPPGFALFLLSTWLVTMNLSPLSPFSIVVADAVGTSSARVALNYNRTFGLAMLLAAPALIVLLG